MTRFLRELFDNMTVRLSWILVLLTFSTLVVALGVLGLYVIEHALETIASMGDNAEYQAIRQEFAAIAETSRIAIIALLVVTAGVAIVVMWGVSVNVIRPLERVVGHFSRMAEGDLSAHAETHGTNEIGRLFSALQRVQTELSRTVGKVRHSSRSIYAGSQGIAHGNHDLSSRTEQQAASLEETAASMEQLTSIVGQNAENARQASQLAQSASKTAEQGGEVVGQVVDTMREITTTSRKAVEIIGVIDSIAFQTNMIALNASVEAARAGEQGRGFAVVASEVRSLAGRSSDAAKQIRTMIEASASRVDDGSRLVDQAGSTMGDIVVAVQRVNDIMDEIAVASQEQNNGIGQVNLAITQMDQVTQQNARLVQESAKAADELERQAAILQESVMSFRLSVEAEQQDGWSASEFTFDVASSLPEQRPTEKRLPHKAAKVVQARAQELEWQDF